MRRLALVGVITVLFFACGGENRERNMKPAQAVPEARLEAVVIEPDTPTVETGVRAMPRFRENPRRTVPLTYEWFVNGDRVPEVEKAALPREKYQREDRIRCRVRPHAGGRWIKSDSVTVLNAPPHFRPGRVPGFDIPGEFIHQVFAEDPDNDPVTYRLVSPLDRGIELDPRTGMIRWRVESLPEEAQPGTQPRMEDEGAGALPAAIEPEPAAESEDPFLVALRIEADDGHGGIARHQILLDLRRGEEVIDIH